MDKLIELELETYATGLISSDQYHGKPVVVFNSASFCGFTNQIENFQQMFSQGQIVPVALPTNEFGGQDPGDNYEIQQFLQNRYAVQFPVCLKTDLNHVLFQKYGKPDWNFNKYLFDREHNFVAKFESNTTPEELLTHV